MRAREFLKELKLDIPDQMVSVQVPLSAIKGQLGTAGSPEGDVDNPGKRIDSKGDVKWSPPLQQHLDAVKDSVGPSDQAVSVDPDTEEEAEQHSPHGVANDPTTRHLEPVAVKQAQALPKAPEAARRIPTLARLPGVLG